MFPGMTYCILSTDSDFVIDMSAVLPIRTRRGPRSLWGNRGQ